MRLSAPLFFCYLCLLASSASSAQSFSELRLSDPALQACVQRTAEKQALEDVSQLTELKCHGKGIKSGDGLEQLTALTSLSLFNNKLVNLDVRALKGLTYLNVANNKLKTLHVDGLSELATFFAFRNQLDTVDLSGLHQVSKIRLMQNRLTVLDITPLKALETGYFFDNKLEDLQITGLEKLTFLDVKQNPMPDELYDFYDEQEGIVISHDGNADDWK